MIAMSHLLYAGSNARDGNLSLRLESPEVVIPRREAFLASHGVRSEDCVFIETQDGEIITHVGSSEKGQMVTTEALITAESGVVLYLLTGDCFPVSFYDPENRVIALAHMGRRPTDKQLAVQVIREMGRVYHSQPENIKVFIAPGIHKESYVFPELTQQTESDWSRFRSVLPSGEIQVDILGNVHDQVLRSGVLPENIEISPVDTATDPDYFSYYRAVRTGEPQGRFATILGLR